MRRMSTDAARCPAPNAMVTPPTVRFGLDRSVAASCRPGPHVDMDHPLPIADGTYLPLPFVLTGAPLLVAAGLAGRCCMRGRGCGCFFPVAVVCTVLGSCGCGLGKSLRQAWASEFALLL